MPSLALSSNHLMLPESIKTCNSADLQKSLTWTGCRWLAPPKQMLPFSPFLSSPQFCWMVVKVLVVVFIFQYFVYKSTKPRITFCRGRTLPTGRVEAGVRQISSRPQRERTPTSLSTILLRMLRNQTKKEQTTWCPAEPSLRSCDNTESCPLPRLSLRHCTMWCDVMWWRFGWLVDIWSKWQQCPSPKPLAPFMHGHWATQGCPSDKDWKSLLRPKKHGPRSFTAQNFVKLNKTEQTDEWKKQIVWWNAG